MEKIFITVVILYALFVGIYFLWARAGKRRKRTLSVRVAPFMKQVV